ncbi:hypothetical protein MPTK1_3g15570 [Marchantia polymorpha subsp. ruderalis]|uniref:Uncharacterized protein n=2 Tax=Marchantia polymorpha TaxID=3197 RepID=A0AAF6B154_MARPO|nr:hypothetical protein MARPO_0004s0115 [Marchantia polymorpha]BBN05738.1 hypothetical protein Mp_3g15570 [Marchantia polymorpha subsp. ruderalis]|eukprot:PTQ48842.1 hypothetical protein MARPO_0004s0115 [Marchantia polymorpha]
MEEIVKRLIYSEHVLSFDLVGGNQRRVSGEIVAAMAFSLSSALFFVVVKRRRGEITVVTMSDYQRGSKICFDSWSI